MKPRRDGQKRRRLQQHRQHHGVRVKHVRSAQGWTHEIDMLPVCVWRRLFRDEEERQRRADIEEALAYVRTGFERFRILTRTSGRFIRTRIYLTCEEDMLILRMIGYPAIYRCYRLIGTGSPGPRSPGS